MDRVAAKNDGNWSKINGRNGDSLGAKLPDGCILEDKVIGAG